MACPETTTMPDEERTPPPPTFAGRLKLEDFKFDSSNGSASSSPSPGGGIRRSSRLSSTTKSTTITTTNASTSPSSASPRKTTQTKTTTTTALTTTTQTLGTPSSKRKLTSASTSTSPAPSGSLTSTSSKRPKKTYDNIPQSLPDALAPNLILLFIGLNPGISTAITQHAYAHPTNLFWRLLYSSGITPVLCSPTEDRTLPERFNLGLTNIVGRPTRNGGELTKTEMDEGVETLEEKVRKWRPEAVAVVGKGIWESIYRVRWRHWQRAAKGLNGKGKGEKGGHLPKDWKYGWQDEAQNMGVIDSDKEGGGGKEDWKGARVFVATSTSGLAATVGRQEKERIWRELGSWVERRRAEREGEKDKEKEKEEGHAGETDE